MLNTFLRKFCDIMFQNCTFIENPGFPNGFTGTIPGDCAFTVNRMQTGK